MIIRFNVPIINHEQFIKKGQKRDFVTPTNDLLLSLFGYYRQKG